MNPTITHSWLCDRIVEDAQVPGRDTTDEFFPDDSSGTLHKLAFWYEYVDDLSSNTGIGATLQNFTTTGGVKKTARYRWNWEKHLGGSAHDFTNVFNLVDAVTPTNFYQQRLEGLVDPEEWMRILAMEHIVGNWDS